MKTKSIIALVLVLSGGLFLSLIAICAGALVYSFREMDSAISPMIDDLFVAIGNDKFADTYDTHLTPEFQKVTTRDQYLQLGQMIKTNLADVAYTGTFEKGAGTITVKLKKVGDQWLLLGFNVNSPVFIKGVATSNCPHCGEPHNSDAKFCSKCGKPITRSSKMEKAAEGEAASP